MAYPRRQVTDEMRRVIRSNTNDSAARLLGVSKSTVSAICQAEGIRCQPERNADGTPRGSKRAEVKRMWDAGASIADICLEADTRVSIVCAMIGIETQSGIALYLSREACERLDAVTPAGVGRDEYVAEIIESFVGNRSI